MAKFVSVACKLPNGVILEHPMDPAIKVELSGLNKAKLIGSEFGTTDVDAEFWEVWSNANKEFGPVLSGAIFAAKGTGELAAVAKENRTRKTGLEPMKKEKDERASGTKPANSDDKE